MTGITDPAQGFFKDGLWGWDGTQWRKLPLVWGYSDRYAELESVVDTGAETTTLTFSTVPAGEVWVVTSFSAKSAQTNVGRIFLNANCGGVTIALYGDQYTVANVLVAHPGTVILAPGDYLTVQFTNCSAGDDIYAYANGYKMGVAE